MRKVILNVAVSLDGYIEDANGAYDWCFTDQDYGLTEFVANTGSMFIGRKSYELIAGQEEEYFPGVKKIYVFSDTMQPGDNEKIELIRSNEVEVRVPEIIEAEGNNIWLFGGASLVKMFLAKRWIGEMHLSVHPIVLGAGKPLFEDLKDRVELILQDSITYSSGLIQLIYVLKPVFDTAVLDEQVNELDDKLF